MDLIDKKLSEKLKLFEYIDKKYGADIEICAKIGMAHDVAKEMSEEEKLEYVKINNIEIDR